MGGKDSGTQGGVCPPICGREVVPRARRIAALPDGVACAGNRMAAGEAGGRGRQVARSGVGFPICRERFRDPPRRIGRTPVARDRCRAGLPGAGGCSAGGIPRHCQRSVRARRQPTGSRKAPAGSGAVPQLPARLGGRSGAGGETGGFQGGVGVAGGTRSSPSGRTGHCAASRGGSLAREDAGGGSRIAAGHRGHAEGRGASGMARPDETSGGRPQGSLRASPAQPGTAPGTDGPVVDCR